MANAIYNVFCSILGLIWNPIITLINFVVGIFQDPAAFLKFLFFSVALFPSTLLPETPHQYTIPGIVDSILASSPVGAMVILKLAPALAQILGLAALIKIYKLIPFKAT